MGLPSCNVTIAVPTLAADATWTHCVAALDKQTRQDFEVIVIDNSGGGRVLRGETARPGLRVIENEHNVGFGSAINQAFAQSTAPFLATINDDAEACPQWLGALLAVVEADPAVGMVASQVVLAGRGEIDSAGMLICGDASSKQRGHGQPTGRFAVAEEMLLPSGAAALYRRSMLEEIGGFDDDFFLYCEDTDLGLRARWAGWQCRYAPAAVVQHRYSHSAGRTSPLKAYYVERNRLFVAVKNFPLRPLAMVPLVSVVRYTWHLIYLLQGKGAAAGFVQEGHGALHLVYFILRAHLSVLFHLRSLWQRRQTIRRTARVSDHEFCQLLRQFAISPQEVAAQ